MGPRAGLDTEARGKILCPCRGSNPDRPVVQHPDLVMSSLTTRSLESRTLMSMAGVVSRSLFRRNVPDYDLTRAVHSSDPGRL
jgi:hypothetical protein